MNDADAAYLAGLFDGEGCIGARERSDGFINLDLCITMTTPAPLQWAQKATGLGGIYFRKEKRPNRKDAWYWKVCKCSDIAQVLSLMRPHLRVKHVEASAFMVIAKLRELKTRSTGPSIHRDAEHRAARLVCDLKHKNHADLYEEALDLAVYLRKAMLERDGK